MSRIPDDKNPFGPRVRFCGHHCAKMKTAIQDVGLWPRVSATPQALQARLARFDPYDVDPMMLLHNMLMGKARHTAALNDVTLTDRCPICFFDVGLWIDEAAAAVKARLEQLDREKLDDQAHQEKLAEDARSL